MSLADQIIEHQPWGCGLLGSIQATGDELNELRAELLELRRLRATAEARRSIEIDPYCDGDPWMSLECNRCGAGFDDLQAVTLAELVRRADEHTEGCR